MEAKEELFNEMLQRFPELPRETVQSHINLYPRNRTALIAELDRISMRLEALHGGDSENTSSLYSDFQPSINQHAQNNFPLPELPPVLMVTPPVTPDKNTYQAPQLGIAGKNGDYEHFLLENQKQRLRALEEAAQKNQEYLINLREVVRAKERLAFERTLNTANNSGITVDTLLELTQANRQLCVKNQCLVTEIDLHTDGRAPLGFYDNIYKGQQDPVVDVSRQGQAHGRWNCPKCTFTNHPAINNCEMCSTSRLTLASKSSRKLSDDTSCSDSLSLSDDSSGEATAEIQIDLNSEHRGHSPICLRVRQRTPKDSVTFRFYSNIDRD